MDNLTPTLNDGQLKQNIDHMLSTGMAQNDVQNYVNNYAKGSDGNYTLKSKQGGSFLGDEKNNVNSIAQSFKDTQSGAISPVEGGIRGVAGATNLAVNTPASYAVKTIMAPYNYLASKTPVNSYGYHLLPTSEDAAKGFQASGLAGASQSFSENHPRLSQNIGAVKDIVTGALTTAGAIKGVQALRAPPDIQNTLMQTGTAGEADAPGYAKTISERFGVNDLRDARQVAIANNNANRLIETLNQKAGAFQPDTISGELPLQAQGYSQEASFLDSARKAMLNAAGVPASSPGFFSSLVSNTGRGLLGDLRKVAVLGGGITAANLLEGSPLLSKLNPFK